jgi:hypothetical protein
MSISLAPSRALAPLIEACDEFDTICSAARARTLHQSELLRLQGDLWQRTARICAGIDAMQPQGDAELLCRFRDEHLHPKVIAWYRRNSHFDRLWTKAAGYSGDYATIELLCQGRCRYLHFNDVFANHIV